MQEYRLRRKDRISRKGAKDMIVAMARFGNHYHRARFETEADVKRFLARDKYEFDDLVEKCRNWPEAVPAVENLIGSTFSVSAGATVSRVDAEGNEDLTVVGPGTITMAGYWGIFEHAAKDLERAVENASNAELYSAITGGIAAIEGYLNHRAEEWNKRNPSDPLEDSFHSKISFEDKIDVWLPKMTVGRKLDKSTKNWADFKMLRSIRDNLAIHPKSSGYSTSYTELADRINRFRTGIAGLLVDLHKVFGQRIPATIIRGSFAPDVEVVSPQ